MKELFISEVHNMLPNTEGIDFVNSLFKSDKYANESGIAAWEFKLSSKTSAEKLRIVIRSEKSYLAFYIPVEKTTWNRVKNQLINPKKSSYFLKNRFYFVNMTKCTCFLHIIANTHSVYMLNLDKLYVTFVHQ